MSTPWFKPGLLTTEPNVWSPSLSEPQTPLKATPTTELRRNRSVWSSVRARPCSPVLGFVFLFKCWNMSKKPQLVMCNLLMFMCLQRALRDLVSCLPYLWRINVSIMRFQGPYTWGSNPYSYWHNFCIFIKQVFIYLMYLLIYFDFKKKKNSEMFKYFVHILAPLQYKMCSNFCD